jgi:hypothetical protein
MRIHFKTRSLARSYAKAKQTAYSDAGASAKVGKRWYCEIVVKRAVEPVKASKQIVINHPVQRENMYDTQNQYSATIDAWRNSRKPSNEMFIRRNYK